MKVGISAGHRGWVRVIARLGATLVVAGLAADPSLAQCAMCRDAVASSPLATREAMNYAIIGLAFAPYGIAAAAAWALSPAVRGKVRSTLRRFRAGKDEGS